MAMSPTQRPRGVLGFWSSLMTALGNMEHMPVGNQLNVVN
jgi:vacuolar protein sorting-associated protein 13A/C